MFTISPGETPPVAYDAALVTAVTTGCGALITFCACGITSSVIDCAGKVVLTPLEATLRSGDWRTMAARFALLYLATLRSGDWRTMAARFALLYCHTCAVPAGEKLDRPMVSAMALAVLFSTSTVSAES